MQIEIPMKRVSKICRELNISLDRIADFCSRFELSINNPNAQIDEETEKAIINYFKFNKEPETGITEPIEENEEYLFSSLESIVLEKNSFENREKRILIIDDEEIETIFSDLEAFSICQGLPNNHATNIARKYFQQLSTSKDRFDAHFIAMRTLDEFGSKILTFLISLPSRPFTRVDTTNVFKTLDKQNKSKKFPSVRIQFENADGNTEKIHISFYLERQGDKINVDKNRLLIKNMSTRKDIMTISRSGIVTPTKHARHFIPILQLFVSFSKETEKYILNYGLETGECSICHRKLTINDSILKGIGPICHQRM